MLASGCVPHVNPFAEVTMRDRPQAPAHLYFLLQPDVAAVLTPNNYAFSQMCVAIQADIDDDFSVADADLEGH